MNKSIHRLLYSSLLATVVCVPLYADDTSSTDVSSPQDGSLSTYLLNLGGYLGYNLAQQPPTTPSSELTNATTNQLVGPTNGNAAQIPFFTVALDVLLGATPVNAVFSQFVPSTNTTYSLLNALANTTFPSFNTVSSQQTSSVTVNPAIDQTPFQQDPVSQAVLNTLGTPNTSYCMSFDGTTWTGGPSTTGAASNEPYPKCQFLNQYQVMSNVIGNLPTTYQYYTGDYNQQFLSQLNSNTLIAPLLYSTTAPNTNTTSSSPQSLSTNGGLPAQSQMQQAANFIRYAAGDVSPGSLPALKDYSTLYSQAMNTQNNITLDVQMKAQATLASYFTKLRSYAAVTSVAYSNLYYVLSKRLPQNTSGSDSSSATSQALNEFTMATWRLYTPGGNTNANWLNQINQAPPATVEKEMVTLLAEINYQLYLTRQQQERLLLTNTMLLLVNARTAQPVAPTLDNSAPQP